MRSIKLLALTSIVLSSCAQQVADGNPATNGDALGDSADASSGRVGEVSSTPDSVGPRDAVAATGAALKISVDPSLVLVDELATGGTGASSSPWTGWESGLNALPPETEIRFPAGYYAQSSTIRTKVGWTLRGAGSAASFIISSSTFTGDAIQSISPYNSSSAIRLLIEDLQLIATGAAPTGAGIDIVGGTFAEINRVVVQNYKYGAVLDQAELIDMDTCEFSASTTTAFAGVWIVNNEEHQNQGVIGVPNFPTPLPRFTNRIGIRKSQFNSINSIAIIDDGGFAHTFEDNNFNGGAVGLRFAGASAARLSGSNMAGQSLAAVISSDRTAQGNTGPGPSTGAYLGENQILLTTAPGFRFDSAGSLTLANNVISTGATAVTGVANVQDLTAFGNRQLGAGSLYDSEVGTGIVSNGGRVTIGANGSVAAFVSSTGVGVQTSEPGAELEVNGGIRLLTSKVQPACGPATRGEFWFVQGAINVKDSVVVCAKGSGNNYLWRTIY